VLLLLPLLLGASCHVLLLLLGQGCQVLLLLLLLLLVLEWWLQQVWVLLVECQGWCWKCCTCHPASLCVS
jgi:hypothetical protein